MALLPTYWLKPIYSYIDTASTSADAHVHIYAATVMLADEIRAHRERMLIIELVQLSELATHLFERFPKSFDDIWAGFEKRIYNHGAF